MSALLWIRSMEDSAAIAQAWLAAFNRHDVPALISLYAPHATHSSPKIRALHPETGGKLVGTQALAEWWREAITRLPSLRYELSRVVASSSAVVIEYVRHVDGEQPLLVAEVFEIERSQIVASRVYHG